MPWRKAHPGKRQGGMSTDHTVTLHTTEIGTCTRITRELPLSTQRSVQRDQVRAAMSALHPDCNPHNTNSP
jgi:hypothetical protein